MSLRVGIVGLGRMGLHHVRCVGLARGMELAAVSDADPDKAASAPEGVPFFSDPADLAGKCDAVVLAVPSDRHEAIGREILAAGCHLLVEKPLAVDLTSCRALMAAADGRVLGVGHVERLNGAWAGVRERLAEPRFVEGHRLAVYDPRGTEVDVVLDLMIHDLDLVLDAFGAEPVRVDAVGVAVLSDRVDIASARLEFPGGGLANLTASRVSRKPVRKLRLFQEDAYFSLDLHEQRAEVFSRRPDAPPLGVAVDTLCAPDGHNPLVRELEEFAAAIRGETSALPTAEEGTRAVSLANRILEAIDERRAVWAAAGARGAPWVDAPS